MPGKVEENRKVEALQKARIEVRLGRDRTVLETG